MNSVKEVLMSDPYVKSIESSILHSIILQSKESAKFRNPINQDIVESHILFKLFISLNEYTNFFFNRPINRDHRHNTCFKNITKEDFRFLMKELWQKGAFKDSNIKSSEIWPVNFEKAPSKLPPELDAHSTSYTSESSDN
uniref:Uncharacterized protein n=1 Tax=Timema genevievae TaxID=629358 RepID=A0A7R9K7B1_TIMGE|nr:unnamed protein product [Timema genevievae]